MAEDRVISGGGRVFRYLLGGMLLALAAFGAFSSEPSYVLALVVATGGAVILVGHRIFRPAITRESGAVVCHYAPWQETGAYTALGVAPLIGICAVALAFQSNSPFFGWGGVFLIVVAPMSLIAFLRAQRRCLLRITPAALTVPRPADGWTVIDIPREAVQSITASRAMSSAWTWLPIAEIRYTATGTGRGGGTVRVGPATSRDTVWLTIQPDYLLTALQMWNDGDPDDPQLLERVDAALRSGAAAGGR
ncbi:MAG: hypothetical protein FGM52_00925 [Mycobacterium sp.]|nr:hypothetical protein [Mycobacterium sp.]